MEKEEEREDKEKNKEGRKSFRIVTWRRRALWRAVHLFLLFALWSYQDVEFHEGNQSPNVRWLDSPSLSFNLGIPSQGSYIVFPPYPFCFSLFHVCWSVVGLGFRFFCKLLNIACWFLCTPWFHYNFELGLL